MTRKNKILLAVATLVLVASAFCFFSRPAPEPSYNGKTVSQWIEQYQKALLAAGRGRPGSSPGDFEQANDAIQHIGSNAVPTLVKLVATRDSSLKRFLTNHVSEAWAARLHFSNDWDRYCSASIELPGRGQMGFMILGPTGRDAVPDLIRIFETSDNPRARWSAASSLGSIGSAARAVLPQLVDGLRDPDPDIQSSTHAAIISIVSFTGPNDRPQAIDLVLPPLIAILKDPKADPFFTIQILGEIGRDARPAVPALVPLINSTNLSSYSQTIMGRITMIVDSNSLMIGRAARQALEKIDPYAIK